MSAKHKESNEATWELSLRSVAMHLHVDSDKVTLWFGRIDAVALWLFLAAFVLYSMSHWLLYSTQTVLVGEASAWFHEAVFHFFCLAMGFKLLSQTYTPARLALAVAIFACAWKSRLVCNDRMLFFSIVVLLAAQGVSLRQLSLASFAAVLAVLLLNALLVPAGLSTDVTIFRGETVRHSLGWSHPNGFGAGMTSLCCSWVGARQKKLSFWEAGAIAIAALGVSAITDSRTVTIALGMLVVLCVTYKLALGREVVWRRASRIAGVAYLCIVFACFFTAVYYMLFADFSQPYILQLDNLLSGRLWLARVYAEAGGLAPWGINVGDPAYREAVAAYGIVTEVPLLVDNAYAHLIIHYGTVVAWIAFLASIVAGAHMVFLGDGLIEGLLSLVILSQGITEFTSFIAAMSVAYWFLLAQGLYGSWQAGSGTAREEPATAGALDEDSE